MNRDGSGLAMRDQGECTTGKRRIFSTIAMITAAAGAVFILGPATAETSAHGIAIHHALVGGGLIGLAGLVFAVGCLRGETTLLSPIPVEKAQAIADERRVEARRIIDEAARCAPSDQKPQA